MTHRTSFLAAIVLAATTALPSFAADDGITIVEPYARASSPSAKSGAIFMMIHNDGAMPDRLIGAKSPAAQRVELHTHKENADGVMQMLEVEEGFAIPAGDNVMLARGGHHVMLMGLTQSLNNGDQVPLTLMFEKAGEVTLEVPVDLDRKPAAGSHGGHGAHNH
ncbi:MAG: copper chaperone PCu(A)C [Pseudomonadota bacterium]